MSQEEPPGHYGGLNDNWSPLRGGDASGATDCQNGWWVDTQGDPDVDMNGGQAHMPAAAFDFNNPSQQLPWHKPIKRAETPEDDYIKLPRFQESADGELLAYFASRSISYEFLREIDLFLEDHPEIESCSSGRNMLRELSALRPMAAYMLFIRGYTKPARYLNGVIRTDYFQFPQGYQYYPLRYKYDIELSDFFGGFNFRWDIIERIDYEVYQGIVKIHYGRDISSSLRKLVSYAVFGNPVDAYKYFEYTHQREFLPHRYLPDHIILCSVPKPENYEEPKPSVLGASRRHAQVRMLMARARDQGVDVVDVLLKEYKLALLRKGHGRVEVDRLCAIASKRLDEERRYPTGADIVNMVMDNATYRRFQPRRVVSRSFPNRDLPRTQRILPRRTFERVYKNGKFRCVVRMGPSWAQTEVKNLRKAKVNLEHYYAEEKAALKAQSQGTEIYMEPIHQHRGRAERHFVSCLIAYRRTVQSMTKAKANELNSQFTRKKMKDQLAHSSERYLLDKLYPIELY